MNEKREGACKATTGKAAQLAKGMGWRLITERASSILTQLLLLVRLYKPLFRECEKRPESLTMVRGREGMHFRDFMGIYMERCISVDRVAIGPSEFSKSYVDKLCRV